MDMSEPMRGPVSLYERAFHEAGQVIQAISGREQMQQVLNRSRQEATDLLVGIAVA